VVRAVVRQDFWPLPYREFPIGSLAEAFEHMAQGRHIGKLLVMISGMDTGPLGQRRSRGRPLGDILGRGAVGAMAGAGPAPPAVSGEAKAPIAAIDPTHARPALATAYRPPEGPTEAGVVAIWEELLGVSSIGADDNFFELRGDSLLAAQVTSRLYAAFQVKLPLSSVFENPTAAGLAARIERMRQSMLELAMAPTALPDDSEVEHEL
jgi:acyl carrier protein